MDTNRILETWAPVVGFENIYSISSIGRVKNRSGLILKPIKRKGYLTVNLCDNGKPACIKSIHRLMCESFIPNNYDLPVINHKDGNKCNNVIDNLEWCTISYNTKHAYINGLAPIRRNESNVQFKLKDSEVKEIRRMLSVGIKGIEISKLFKISISQVSRIKNNKQRII